MPKQLIHNQHKIYVIEERHAPQKIIYMIFWESGHWRCHGLDGDKLVKTKTLIHPEQWPSGAWIVGDNHSTMPSLNCAECGAMSYYDYLCESCRTM